MTLSDLIQITTKLILIFFATVDGSVEIPKTFVIHANDNLDEEIYGYSPSENVHQRLGNENNGSPNGFESVHYEVTN